MYESDVFFCESLLPQFVWNGIKIQRYLGIYELFLMYNLKFMISVI